MKPLEKAVYILLDRSPFFAHVYLNSRVEMTKSVPTAGVRLSQNGLEMFFNPEWINSLSPDALATVIEHEILHVAFDHVKVKSPKGQHMLYNIAQDCAINQWLDQHHINSFKGVTLDSLSKELEMKLEPKQTWEYYYNKIMESGKVKIVRCNFDDHGSFGDDTDSDGNPIAEDEAKGALKDILDKAAKQSKGNIPEALEKIISELNKAAKLPWKQLLANFVASCTVSKNRHTRKKANRRYGLDQPGRVRLRELRLGVCEDTSGSISLADTARFRSEISQIVMASATVVWVDADCSVQQVKKLKKGAKAPNSRKGSGGTAYQPAIDECMKANVDAIIYFGDFDTSDVPKDPGVPFLWVGVGDQEPPAKFGRVIRLD